ncbi:class I SAM-dependent methyltransferase [Sulfurovum mangrovi]|uniref:class I SAM-dependent methyltransferase n=1 Tax=Sulfurovum mangrovi TaxID=2893889 RepID=UPI001E2D2CB7|nr:methyltransferase domain-containing protein [Sulfurovum mangrovi]UFH58032.1 methyltransferase domain-containing protein [Sulfurovum mangrovi]
MGIEKTNLSEVDFPTLYSRQMANSTFQGKSVADWDEKSKNYLESVRESDYIDALVERIDLTDAETLLDIGCGPGSLSLPLAKRLEHVFALDYSTGMLKTLEEECESEGVKNIVPFHRSWEEEWSDIPEADIVIASRSLEVKDIEKALKKMASKAKQKVYLTFKVGGSFVDEEILEQIQRKVIPRPDYIYLVNTLHQMGIYAKVDFIRVKNNKFKSRESEGFVRKVQWSLGELSASEEEELKRYFQNVYHAKQDQSVTEWALISWEVNQ